MTRRTQARGRPVDVDIHSVLDALGESAAGLLRRSGTRSIPPSSCRPN